jgi:hypothetical protein
MRALTCASASASSSLCVYEVLGCSPATPELVEAMNAIRCMHASHAYDTGPPLPTPCHGCCAVFGFAHNDLPLVLREFGKCGDIMQFGTFGDAPQANWIHINYAVSPRQGCRQGLVLGCPCVVLQGKLHVVDGAVPGRPYLQPRPPHAHPRRKTRAEQACSSARPPAQRRPALGDVHGGGEAAGAPTQAGCGTQHGQQRRGSPGIPLHCPFPQAISGEGVCNRGERGFRSSSRPSPE